MITVIGKVCEYSNENGSLELWHRVNINGVEIWSIRFDHIEPSIGTHILNYVFHSQALTKYKEFYETLQTTGKLTQ